MFKRGESSWKFKFIHHYTWRRNQVVAYFRDIKLIIFATTSQKKVFRFLPEVDCKVLGNYFVWDGALGVVGLGVGLG